MSNHQQRPPRILRAMRSSGRNSEFAEVPFSLLRAGARTWILVAALFARLFQADDAKLMEHGASGCMNSMNSDIARKFTQSKTLMEAALPTAGSVATYI